MAGVMVLLPSESDAAEEISVTRDQPRTPILEAMGFVFAALFLVIHWRAWLS